MTNLLIFLFVVFTIAAAAILHLPTLAWSPLLIGAFGVMLARMSAREQVRLSERKLFIDLIPRRSEWVSDLSSNVTERDKEAHQMMSNLLNHQPMGDPVHLMAIWKSRREAKWLFGERMYDKVQLLIDAEAELSLAMLKARTGNQEAAASIGKYASTMDDRLGDVMDEAAEYLYVGDIARRKGSTGLLSIFIKRRASE